MVRKRAQDPEGLDELLREVRRVEIASRKIADGALAGAYDAAFKGPGLEFEEVREYEPGDDPRRLDHALTERLQRPFVRSYVDEREWQILFVLDTSASMRGGPGPIGLLALAARVIGSIALSAIRHRDRVGLITFADACSPLVAPRKGEDHVLRLVRICLAAAPQGGSGALGSALERARRSLTRRAIVIVLSDFLASGFAGELERASARHDVIAMRLSPAPRQLPPHGLLRLRGPETGREVTIDLGDPATRRWWRDRDEDARRRFRDLVTRAGADGLELEADGRPGEDPVGPHLARFFRQRTGRRGWA